jgi:hypothetical protein
VAQVSGEPLSRIRAAHAFGVREVQDLREPVLGGGLDQGLPGREMPVHGADADPCDPCHLGMLHLIAAFGEQGASRV